MAVSRNALCPCGSGKKFKRCCGSNSQGEPSLSADQLFRQSMQLRQQGQFDKAITACREALKKAPRHEMGHALLAQHLTFTNDNHAAAEAFSKAISLGLTDPAIHFQYGNVLLATGNVIDAIEQYNQALKLNPNLAEPHINLGNIYLELEKYHDAEYHHRKAIEINPENWKAHAQRAASLVNLIRHDEAMEELDRAIKSAPKELSLYTQQAGMKEKSNLLDEAEALLAQAQQISPEAATVKILESHLKVRRKDYQSAWDAISAIHVDEEHPQHEAFVASLAYQRGDILDKLARYDEALQNYLQANRLMKSNRAVNYTSDETAETFASETAFFTVEKYEQLQKLAPNYPSSTLTPIFIVGFFRSGTTLTEQILASHPDIVAAGELSYIEQITRTLEEKLGAPYPQCLDKLNSDNRDILTEMREFYLAEVQKLNLPFEGKRWVTDKMPLNMLHLPLIHLLFPESPLVHTLRHPMDSALSCFFHQFSRHIDWSFDLDDTIDFFGQAATFTDNTIKRLALPVHAVRYETLVETPEPLVRALLKFIGAEWNDACLEFHKNNRVARTLSYAQVNQPIYKGSKLRYLNYMPYLSKERLNNMKSATDVMGYEI